nr:putative GH32 family protein [Macrotrachela quadricornifera]
MIMQVSILFLILNQILLFIYCISIENSKFNDNNLNKNDLICNKPSDDNNYIIYSLSIDDNSPIGDVMPYFDYELNQLYILYLKDIWNDFNHQRHPWYGLKTNNFYSYSLINQDELLNSNTNECSQDYAIGTGSIIKKDNIYYAFYTGHNPNSPSYCIKTKEGIMLATSLNLNNKFIKDLNFKTIYPPIEKNFDEENNFRDPFVFYDINLKKYTLIISARTTRGVIIYYTSYDLYNWLYQGILYDGDSTYFYMMETPDLFQINNIYYLIFSDIDTKNVYYRKSLSLYGPWEKPTEHLIDRFDAYGLYGAKVIRDNYNDYYIFGWTNQYENNNDYGQWKWGGNLIIHKLYQLEYSKDLAITIPHTIKNYFEIFNQPIIKHSQWGIVQDLSTDILSYSLSSLLNSEITNVLFNPINLIRYKISTIISYTRSIKDFGFMINVCDGYNQFYSLRFIPSQHRFSFDKINRSSLTSTTISTIDIQYKFIPNTDYIIHIIIENSMVITYIDHKVALTARIYNAGKNSWGIFADNSNVIFKNLTVTRP